MDEWTQPRRPEPTDAEREFWRRAVEAARRRADLPNAPPADDEDP